MNKSILFICALFLIGCSSAPPLAIEPVGAVTPVNPLNIDIEALYKTKEVQNNE